MSWTVTSRLRTPRARGAPQHAVEGLADADELACPVDRGTGWCERPAQRRPAVDGPIPRARPPAAQEDPQQRQRGRPGHPRMHVVQRVAAPARIPLPPEPLAAVPADVRPVRTVGADAAAAARAEPVGVDVDAAAQGDEAIAALDDEQLLVVALGG